MLPEWFAVCAMAYGQLPNQHHPRTPAVTAHSCRSPHRLTSPARETDMVGLLNQNAQSAGEVIDENAPSHRVFAGDADRGDWPYAIAQTANHSGSMTTGNAPICQHVRWWRWEPHHPIRPMPNRSATDPTPKPRPVLPGGALWRWRCGHERAAPNRPLHHHAAMRCSSTSSTASAVSVSPPSTSSAATAAAGSGSSGTSGSASQAARLAAATAATPPRWV